MAVSGLIDNVGRVSGVCGGVVGPGSNFVEPQVVSALKLVVSERVVVRRWVDVP